MSNPRRIDVHHHYIPPDYALLLREKGIRPGGIPLPAWAAPATSRIMAANGVESAIVSLSTPGVWFGDAGEARRWARRVNEFGAALVADNPRGFGFFATLTLPDVDGALVEAAYALDVLRADGIVLLANNAGIYLGDPRFARLLAFLDERAAVVLIHPGELPGEPIAGLPTFAADFLLDTTRTVLSLMLSGAMDTYPHIRFILAHAGGFVPYVAHRLLLATLREEPKIKLAGLLVNRKRAVAQRMQVFKRFWYDTALSSTPAAFPSLLAVADPSHILFGSDFPFAPPQAVKFMRAEYEDLDLDPAVRAGIDRGNAETLFPRLAGGQSTRPWPSPDGRVHDRPMTLTPAATTLDCTDVAAVSAFWSAALDRPLDPGASAYFARISAQGPGASTWMFIGVPEPKTAKNRLHIDFVSDDRAADVDRLLALGATKVADHDEYGHRWTTLRDVEGNEFCVADPHA